MSGVNPKTLPIRDYAEKILKAVRSNPVTIVIGETGSGKTTQISQVRNLTVIVSSCVHVTVICNKEVLLMGLVKVALWVQILEEAGFAEHGRIAVTQPRRVVCATQLIILWSISLQ